MSSDFEAFFVINFLINEVTFVSTNILESQFYCIFSFAL